MIKITRNSKVTLVELPATQFGEYNGDMGHDVYSMFRLPSRGLHAIEGVIKDQGFSEVQLLNPLYHGKNGRMTPANEQMAFNSDVLLLSAITRTAPQTMSLGKNYRHANPMGLVIAGGPDPTFRTKEWLISGAADVVAQGEGEDTIREVMRTLTSGGEISDVEGIAFMKNGEVVENPRRKLLKKEDLSNLVHPFYDDETRSGVRTAPLETSRGCPNRCDFCTVRKFYGGTYRTKEIDYVMREFENIQRMGAHIFLTDDNFIGNPERAKRLAVAIAEKRKELGDKRKLSAQVTVKVAEDPKLMDALWNAGIRTFYIGIESLNDGTLTQLNKPYTAQQNEEYVRIIREKGFWVHGMMMLGGDNDTKEDGKYLLHWANNNLDSLQLFPPTPLPGSELHRTMTEQGRMLTTEPHLYDCQHVVFRPNPNHFSPAELQTEIMGIYDSFYSKGNLLRRAGTRPQYAHFNLLMLTYLHLFGGLEKAMNAPQTRQHMKFLKSVS